MDNGMESMLDIYLFETNSLLEQLDEILMNCEKADDFDQDSINEIFRIMHTIKGSSAMMEFNSLMTVAHRVEDLFNYVRSNGVAEKYRSGLFDLMFQCSDFLKSEVANVENNVPLTIDIGNLVEEINNMLKKISTGEDVADAPSTPSVKTSSTPAKQAANVESTQYCVKVFFDPEAQMENLRAYMLAKSISDAGIEFTYEPEDIQTNPDTLEIVKQDGFLIKFTSEELRKNALHSIEQFIYIKDYSLLEIVPQVQKAETKTVTEKAAAPQHNQAAPKQSLINVNLAKLDTLMDLVGEIVISESMITAIPTLGKINMESFSKSTRQLSKLTDELQEIVMSLRMVPVAGAFQKMNRIVRDMCKKLNKDVDLVLIGEETEVDKTIVDNIGDPLMHLVRNAMDHGIEDEATRIAAGKPAKGTVTLSAQNTGSEILITIQDDGKGMDPDKILVKAREKGLAKPDVEYSKKEIIQFVLAPGFSTKEKATEFSGRGVGMDVVKQNVEKVGGTVFIESEVGKGSQVIFKIPLSLSIVKGMQVTVGESMFTIPINNIRQSFKATDDNIMLDSNKREIVMIRNEYYPVIKLHEIYNIETDVKDIKDGILILVEVDDKSYCIFADVLLGEQQVVVKPIPKYLNKYNVKEQGIGGCAILGNGSITLILDLHNVGNNS
ncbi:chemotaxis protein CheA [Paludicola sp. MB14-C6]|uniref:chemotaxis protein CheA n=1 Tax=Paludihabitans sp. MB14-C6 TaxID=3070656 RepID=UPI0027DE5E27|nr:chemotaxis protein CheA [Paludicola sp. MB14-C6]WMJ21902.1 chemotaxis protein CheA [Paludicola sp. MB14-C6]